MDINKRLSRRLFMEICSSATTGAYLLHGKQGMAKAFSESTEVPVQHSTEHLVRQKISLNGIWRYRPLARTILKKGDTIVAKTSNLPNAGQMPVPSNWNLHGLTNFNGRVRFERGFDFEAMPSASQRMFLVFHGVDYFANVELNGSHLGRHEGYFQTFEFDITRQLKRGKNNLSVTVDAPKEEVGSIWPNHKRLIKGIFSDSDCKPGGISKQYGQDGTSAGIWNDVELEVRNGAWLRDIKIRPFLYPRNPRMGHNASYGTDALLYISVTVEAFKPGPYELSAEVAGPRVASILTLNGWSQTSVLVLPIDDPQLWWTWDTGEPHLYNCRLTLSARDGKPLCQQDVRFGLRSITLDEKTGEWRLNGERLFIRGTNLEPEQWLSRYTNERIAQDIKLLKHAHINGVRVSAHVNRQELYDALDEAGIAVWQDFPLQHNYLCTATFLGEVSRQLREMIVQFYNHPSIVTWVCQNEASSDNVRIMDPFLAQVGKQEDPSRPVQPVAGFNQHVYEGWYSGNYHDYVLLPRAPIISEFGAQALTSVKETERMVGSSWPPDWEKLAYHDFQYDQTFHVARISMGRDWDEFVENSQRYQAKLLKFAIEHYRRAKYEKVGCLFQFTFVDRWPAVTWSVLSYERQPKLGYKALQIAYQPVLIGAEINRTIFSLGDNPSGHATGVRVSPWVVNDVHRMIEGATYHVSLRNENGSKAIASGGDAVKLPPDSVSQLPPLVCNPPKAARPGPYELVLTLRKDKEILSTNYYEVVVAL